MFILFITILFLSSCASQGREHSVFSDHSKEIYRLNVPFVLQQKEGYCGPVALATVLNYWNDDVNQQQIADNIYLPSLKGSLSVDLVHYANKRGFNAELYFGTFQDMKDKMALGYPLIAILGDHKNVLGHYIVLVGYDDFRQQVIIHKEKSAYETMSYKEFLLLWSNMDKLTILIAPQ